MTDSRRYLERLRALLDEARAQGDAVLAPVVAAFRAYLGEIERLDLWEAAKEVRTGGKTVSKGARHTVRTAVGEFEGRYEILARSPKMRALFDLMEKIIPSDFPALIQGESGTGKELVARALHQQGPRRSKPFLSENCAAIPETLLESELFGHVKGAFTGAVRERPGHFRSADTGTIFLDEIGDMPLGMQSKLLRVLQDGEVRPVGGSKTFRVDVRVVAASNKNLPQLVAKGGFREDLLFRMNVFTLDLPPLREREGDVALLVEYFTRLARNETGREVEMSPEALALLEAYAWPGNVRQLENEIRRSVALSDTIIRPEDLSPEIRR